ncbi:MAG: TIGR02996 domain-containing protein, partial [Gemmataceae bacterium]|nr:TIGR02996 domain-containing protein [Gemmataceae bacterium]
QPDDDTPRLVLADWLDEQDDPLDAARAAFIRKDIARARGEKALLPAAELEAAKTLLVRWLGPMVKTADHYGFQRGLPAIKVPAAWFLRGETPGWLASESFAFVQHVITTDASGRQLEDMVRIPEFRHVPGLSVQQASTLGSSALAQFFESPNLSGLRRIELTGANIGVAGAQALADNPASGRLRRFTLSRNKLVDRAVVALAAARHLTNLDVLNLSCNEVGDAGADALAASSALPTLRELDLTKNPRLTARGKQALRDALGDRVKLD